MSDNQKILEQMQQKANKRKGNNTQNNAPKSSNTSPESSSVSQNSDALKNISALQNKKLSSSTNAPQTPNNGGQKPVNAGQKPIDVGQKPVDVGQKPVNVGQKPVDLGQKPIDVGQKPVDVGNNKSKTNNVFFKLLIITGLLVIIGGAGATYYFWNSKSKQIVEQPEPSQGAVEQDGEEPEPSQQTVEQDWEEPEPSQGVVEQGLEEYFLALNYYNRQEWAKAYDKFNEALSLGYEKAKYYLGLLYFGDEQNTTLYRNRAKAFEYLNEFPTNPEAANDGLGYVYLGYMYMTGQGTDRDISAGEEVYEKAFEDAVKTDTVGVFVSRYGIAPLYYNGFHGVPVDREKAKHYFDREVAEMEDYVKESLGIPDENINYDIYLRQIEPAEESCGDECRRAEGVYDDE